MKKNVVLSSVSALAIFPLLAFLYNYSLPALQFSPPSSADLFSETIAADQKSTENAPSGHLCLDVPLVVEKKVMVTSNEVSSVEQVNLRLTYSSKNGPNMEGADMGELSNNDLYLLLEKHQLSNIADTQGQYLYKYEAVMARLKTTGIIDGNNILDKDVASCASKNGVAMSLVKAQDKAPGA